MTPQLEAFLPSAAGMLLLVLGLLCLVLEIKVVSYGILTLLGLGLSIGGLVLLFDDVPWGIVIPIAVAIASISATLTVMVVRTRNARPLGDTGELVGRIVSVTSEVGPDGGKVLVDGVYWSAVSPKTKSIAKGAKVRITGAKGLVLEVEPDA